MQEITIKIEDKTQKFTLGNSTAVTEAPVDGKQYTRKDAGWNELVGAGGDMTKSTYDPTNKSADAFDYDNFDNTPTTITAQQGTDIGDNNSKVSFPEAPEDGTQYARKDAGWEAVAGGGVSDHTLLSNIGVKTHAQIDTQVDLNNAKTGITSQQSTDITTNNSKTSYTDATAVGLNTAKVGITPTQASDITANKDKQDKPTTGATGTVIDLSKTGGTIYPVSSTANTFTLTGITTDYGLALLYIDTTGDSDFPTVTGSTIKNSAPFEANVNYYLTIRNIDGTNIEHNFVKRDVGTPTTEELIQVACSDLTTDIETGTTKGFITMRYDAELIDVNVALLTAGTVTGITVDINKNGTTMLSTLLTTDATEDDSDDATTPAVISVSSLSKGDRITFDFDAVPTGANGVVVSLIVLK